MDFNGLNGLPYLSNIDVTLTIFTEKTVLLNSVQEFIEIEAWMLLTFFTCLHN